MLLKTKPEKKQKAPAVSSRMSSIARSINLEFWMRGFAQFLLLDLVLAGTAAFSFFVWWEGQLPQALSVINRHFLTGSNLTELSYVAELSDGTSRVCLLSPYLSLCKIPALCVLVLEGLFLAGNLFSTRNIRRKMKPLNEIALRTEQLARGKADLRTMEQAVSRLNPDLPDAHVMTGDKELQSLEIAINNLLDRMRESHRQQERFVSDASHELRTPIAVIQGYVNMLDRWGKEDAQILQESIDALKNESEHMKNLVEQLLFLARGDSGRNTLHFEDCDLAQLLQDVMEESSMIDEKHVYRFEEAGGSAEPVRVRGDAAMLKQSMRIFVQNAAKYSGQGGTIVLRAGISPMSAGEHAGRPFYSVQDEGTGMQSSEVVHVFERFYRSDAARNSSQGGTGLGLSIAKWIVDAHSGIIEILSRPEFGTRITVRF